MEISACGHGEMMSGRGKGLRKLKRGAKDELNLLTVAYPKYYVLIIFLLSGLSGKLWLLKIVFSHYYYYFFFSFLKS